MQSYIFKLRQLWRLHKATQKGRRFLQTRDNDPRSFRDEIRSTGLSSSDYRQDEEGGAGQSRRLWVEDTTQILLDTFSYEEASQFESVMPKNISSEETPGMARLRAQLGILRPLKNQKLDGVLFFPMALCSGFLFTASIVHSCPVANVLATGATCLPVWLALWIRSS
jgi:hypothetical protein